MSSAPDVYKETEAMKAVMRTLEGLPEQARERVMDVVDAWFEAMNKEPKK